MPEGVEVKGTTDEIAPVATGQTIVRLSAVGPHGHGLDFKSCPLPMKITRVSSYGKKMILVLANGGILVSSFGMAGRWSFALGDHCRVALSLGESGECKGADGGIVRYDIIKRVLYFLEPRPFGGLEYVPPERVAEYSKGFGVDPLSAEVSMEQWYRIFQDPKIAKWDLVQLFKDQSRIAGPGNYIRPEIFYRARVAPMRLINTLTKDEVDLLHRETHAVMREAYAAGGHTIKDYLPPSGKHGGFAPKVYRRAGEAMVDSYGNAITTYKRLAGDQTTYWVPAVQK